jgi:peptide/nickel transport system ATP-binding protein
VSGSFLRIRGVRRRYGSVTALDGVDLDLAEGDTVGIVGVSGSGKSTLVRLILALEAPDEGSVSCSAGAVRPGPVRSLRPYRRMVQLIPQDAAASLDPRRAAIDLVEEPLRRLHIGDRADQRARAAWCLSAVGIGPELHGRRPVELSGGQAQRVAIARAIAPDPLLIVADEPTSGLDPPRREQVLDLLASLTDAGTGLLLVSHDLSVVAHSCRRTVVLHDGRVIEDRPTAEVLSAPGHERTRALLAAVPRLPV